MKYIEEIASGSIFEYKDSLYLLTSDHRKDNSRLSYSLKTGNCKWFAPNEIIEQVNLYRLDENNNIESISNEEHTKNPNIS